MSLFGLYKDKTLSTYIEDLSTKLNTYLKDGEKEKESTLSKFKKSKTWSDWKKNKNKDN